MSYFRIILVYVSLLSQDLQGCITRRDSSDQGILFLHFWSQSCGLQPTNNHGDTVPFGNVTRLCKMTSGPFRDNLLIEQNATVL